jgi:hypothetical protein
MPDLISNDKIVHIVILRNYAITASGSNQIGKIHEFYVSKTTSFLVTSRTVIDVKIKLM